MNWKFSAILSLLVSAVMITSCISGDDEMITIDDPSIASVEVTSLSLSKNDSIVANLDSLFFSVDLTTGRIYNADSLPVGTKVGKVVLKIETATTSKTELEFKTKEGTDTVIDYLTNPNDSIDFSNGPVTLRLVSSNGLVIRNYSVQINVHLTKPDSLYWDKNDFSSLPSSFNTPTSQKTIQYDGKYYCLTEYDGSYSIGVTDNPGIKKWDSTIIEMPEGALTSTFSSTDDSFYIIVEDELYKSDDLGLTWTATGSMMTHIYGGYGSTLLGVRNSGGKYYHVTYPETTEVELQDNCPISGTSTPLIFASQWSAKPLFMMLGGRCASGEVTGAVWAYDGSTWSAISVQPIPGVEGAVWVPYYTISINNKWLTSTQDVIMAMGGTLADGTLSEKVYISRDRGIHWAQAPEYMQPSAVENEQIEPFTGGQAYVCDLTLGAPASRVTSAITSWACPYIYVFGGTDSSQRLNGIRRGVLNYFTFIPVY